MQNDRSKSFASWSTTSSPRSRLNSGVVSFLSRYPCNTNNQIYSNRKIRIWNPILLVLILCTASFQICLWTSPCVQQSFAHYYSIAPWKISNLVGLSLASSWKPCLFYHPFCYLQNVAFLGSRKNGFESLCSEYHHYHQIIYSPEFSNRG